MMRCFQFRNAIEGLRRRCGEATKPLSGLSQSQMPLLWKSVSSVRFPSWTEIRQRAGGHFWVSVAGLLMFIALIWFPGVIEDTSSRILLVLLYAAIPLSMLLGTTDDDAERRQFMWWNLGFGLFVAGTLLIVISDRQGWFLLGINVFVAMVSAPLLLYFAV